MWGSIDSVCLLAQGRCKFFGPARDAVPFFNGQLGVSCPLRINPGEFFLGLFDMDCEEPASVAARSFEWKHDSAALTSLENQSTFGEDGLVGTKQGLPFTTLIIRALQANTIGSKKFLARLITILVMSLVAGAMFQGVGKDTDQAALDGRASTFFVLQCEEDSCPPMKSISELNCGRLS